jgi:hypothetical protein
MQWVDTDSYVGPDRRRDGRLRLFDRRRTEQSRPCPSLAVLLRQLHLQSLAFETGQVSVDRYVLQMRAICALAVAQQQTGVASWLTSLDQTLTGKLGKRASGATIERHLKSAMAALL